MFVQQGPRLAQGDDRTDPALGNGHGRRVERKLQMFFRRRDYTIVEGLDTPRSQALGETHNDWRFLRLERAVCGKRLGNNRGEHAPESVRAAPGLVQYNFARDNPFPRLVDKARFPEIVESTSDSGTRRRTAESYACQHTRTGNRHWLVHAWMPTSSALPVTAAARPG